MGEKAYQLAGIVHIPEGERDEFNRKVLLLLNRCGIRRTEQLTIAGHSVNVLLPAVPDENGIVTFDYSVFEKKKYAPGTFDTNTGELCVQERGYNEYGVSMNLLMVLQMACSDTPCYLMRDGKLCEIKAYISLLNTVLDEETVCRNGSDVWQTILFFHQSGDCADIPWRDAWNAFPYDGTEAGLEQFWLLLLLDGAVELTEAGSQMHRQDIGSKPRWDWREYLYRLFCRLPDDKTVEPWFRELLKTSLPGRQAMAAREDDLGTIAKISCYFQAPAMVYIYGLSRHEDFWTVWERLGGNGYKDVLQVTEHCHRETDRYPLYRAFRRESEDEFLDFWDGTNLKLSDALTKRLAAWKRTFDEIEIPSGLEVEQMLAEILVDMERDWNCRYADKSFVLEFLAHQQETAYQRLLLVLRAFLDEGAASYPELTRRQAVAWGTKRTRDPYDPVLMSAYLSLMTNHGQRERIFGV